MSPIAARTDGRAPHAHRRWRSKKLVAGIAALALTATGLATAPSATAASHTVSGAEAVDLVNPFIGSQDDGNTFPGATAPFGMIQLSPDTGHGVGYDYTHNEIRGFSQTHLSGVGCPIAGFVPIMPHFEHVQNNSTQYSDGRNRRGILRQNGEKVEEASAGHYGVTIDSDDDTVEVDLTATPRTGIQRYNFNADSANSFVRIYAGNALNNNGILASETHIDVANQTVRTKTTLNGFCQNTNVFTVWSTTKFDQPFNSHGTWIGGTVTLGSTDAVSTGSGNNARTGATLEFDHDATVELQTAISYVSQAGADANLAHDQAEYANNYDDGLDVAQTLWADQLGKVKVTQEDGNAPVGEELTQLRVFYSALYRSFVAPNIGSDVDGKYRGWDGEIHDLADEDLDEYYQNFSLWDTYRTQQQWLYLLEPIKSIDMVKSVVLQSEQSGWLPRWGYGPVETNTMTGDPAAVFLVSAWDQGLLDEAWSERAWTEIKHNADNVPNRAEFANGRAGNPIYIPHGYVPQDKSAKSRNTDYDLDHGASATLEYALADGMISYMARGLGKTEDAERYAQRGQNFRSVWNPAENVLADHSGSMQARDMNGIWVEHDSDEGRSAFHEGTSPQYEWLVQHDVPSLIELLGGRDATEARLDTFFAYEDIDLDNNPGRVARNTNGDSKWWVTGTYDYYGVTTYNPNNEPDFHAPYIYLWTGQPYKASDVVREALQLFTDGPTGVTGNDDLGTMAAWQVASTIGIFPIVPGTNLWGLTTPVFDRVEIALEEEFHGSDKLVITAEGASMTNRYTDSVQVGGQNLESAYINGADLAAAGTLDYTVSDTPSDWATDADASPGAIAPGEVPARFNATVRGGSTAVTAGGAAVNANVSVQYSSTENLSGELVAHPWTGISVTVNGGNVNLNPRGGSAMQNVSVSISADASVKPGSYPVTWQVGDYTSTTDVIVKDVSHLESTGVFNNKAFGDLNNPSSAKFNVGLSSTEFYLRDIAAASGTPLGAPLTHPSDADLTYVLHDSGAGSAANAFDNLVPTGQNTDVEGLYPGATKIAFIVSANNGSVDNATATLNFANNTSKQVSLTAPDWCGWERSGTIGSSRFKQRYAGGAQNINCGLFATHPVSLDGQELVSITWPGAPGTSTGGTATSGDARMHIFAIATDAGLTMSGNAEIDAPSNATLGSELTATAPTFSVGNGDDIDVTYQWLRDGAPITGADGTTYTAGPDDVNSEISVVVTGKAPGFKAQRSASDSVAIAAGTIGMTTAPSISGTAQVSQVLSVVPGTYNPADVSEEYQWLADGAPITGATGDTLTLSSAEQGKRIAVKVTASKAGYNSHEHTTAQVGPVTGAPVPGLVVVSRPQVTGNAKVGQSVRVTPGSYSPAAVESYQWNLEGQAIAGATASTYTVRAADAGKRLSVTVKAVAAGNLSATTTLAAGTVARGTITVKKKPKLKRGKKVVKKKTKVKVGQKVKTTKGKVNTPGAKAKVSYRWFIGKKKVKGKKGAKKAFKVTKKAAGKRVHVRVTYKAPGYANKTVKSNKTPKIRR